MDQHVISAWHLRAFARRAGRSRILHVYDKALDSFGDISVDDFLAETDVHSLEVERGLGKIEAPAAAAAQGLAKLAKPLPPGLYAVTPPGEEIRVSGPALSDKGVMEGMRSFVSEHTIPSPSERYRVAIADYAGLMYQRAPKLEEALVGFSDVYDVATQRALDKVMPGMRSQLQSDVNSRRERMLRNARNIGERLAHANWWVVRSSREAPFVLGDSPVVTTVSLGHDDSWRPILSDATYVVAIALGPTIALLIAPQRFFPVTGIERADQAAGAINRLTWRSASRYVLARDRADLDAALPADDKDVRRATIPVDFDAEGIARSAIRDVERIAAEVRWRYLFPAWHWDGCRLVFADAPPGNG